MSEEKFESLGRIDAIRKLYEGTPYKPFGASSFETDGRARLVTATKVMLEGIDFDLTYFPLKHLGYKCVVCTSGELYAEMAHPKTLKLVLGISAKLDFGHMKQLWEGVVTAAKEHGYEQLGLDLMPSRNGLCITASATGVTSILTAKRQMPPKSMDLICITGNLGAAYFGQQILEREKAKFARTTDDSAQPALEEWKHMIGAYLKPELDAGLVGNLENAGITPGYGCLVDKGLADAVKRLVRDSGLGAKVYVDKLPFAGNSFELGKKLDIDPVTAAMNGGEDCRLLMTIPIGQTEKFRRDFQVCEIIGHLAKPEVGAVVVTPDGVEFPLHAQGWKD